MARFFTWHDIEIVLMEQYASWPESWIDVRVYSDCVEIYHQKDSMIRQRTQDFLKKVYTKNYSIEDNSLLVDFTQTYLDVYLQETDEEKREIQGRPLFKEIYLDRFQKQSVQTELPGARILAFHSYKGGVGRTLSLISLLRQCTEQYPDKKILVIDADLEAPGLTWMLEDRGRSQVSYLDILSVLNYGQDTDLDLIHLAGLIKTSTVIVTTEKTEQEQYFIPVYREKKQMWDISSSPERILATKENRYYITETISRLGKELGADLIIVDLRAGITEYSAPFLFDPRVEKIYVTSTSLQSVKGLNQILEQIYGKTDSNLLKSKVLMTMIPQAMPEERMEAIKDQILADIEARFDGKYSTFLRENYIIPVEFEDALIHIGDFSSVCRQLQNKRITDTMQTLAEDLFRQEEKEEYRFSEDQAREILKKIHSLAEEEVTAEGNGGANMLVTSSIKEIVRNFKNLLPRIVVTGAKGAGKTYIYKQMLSVKTWDGFEKLIDSSSQQEEDILIVPLISSWNSSNLKDSLAECIAYANSELDTSIKRSYVNENLKNLRTALEEGQVSKRSQWVKKWEDAILHLFGDQFGELSELDGFLSKKKKKIILIADGLEDLCMDAQLAKQEAWKYAVRALCQDIINELEDLDFGNLGVIIFARRDMLSEAIETNYEQFRNLYLKYELNWSQTEALRLALWLSARAFPALAGGADVPNATKEVLVEKLTQLWGVKLGRADSKEAFSDRWILASLSDFTGQLQARDIVRFLKYSTSSYDQASLAYHDRLIMPLEIRKAIAPCSGDKLTEIKLEMRNIYEILEKFMHMDDDKKSLPLTLDKIDLTAEQISRLETQGLLKISDKKYYLPEIIRLALGFKYEQGARPKVLSLLVK